MKSKSQRQEEAKERNDAYAELTTKQKILKLDLMFGEGLGAKRQRSKLAFEMIQEAYKEGLSVEGADDQKPKKKPYQKPKRS